MRVIVVGCGRVGATLAGVLQQRGYQVTMVDRNPRAFRLLGDEFVEGPPEEGAGARRNHLLRTQRGFRCVLGVGIDEEVLRTAGVEGADAFAAVTDNDYTNIMASLIAREIYKIPRVIARITDPQRGSIFHEMGIETICPTTLGAQSIAAKLEACGEGP